MRRQCTDCGYRYDFELAIAEAWRDPMICPACRSDETVGVPDVAPEREMAMLAGEAA